MCLLLTVVVLVLLTIMSEIPSAVDMTKRRESDYVIKLNPVLRWTNSSGKTQPAVQKELPGMKKNDREEQEPSGQTILKAIQPKEAEGGKINETKSQDVFVDKLPENRQPDTGADVRQAETGNSRIVENNRHHNVGMEPGHFHPWSHFHSGFDRNEDVFERGRRFHGRAHRDEYHWFDAARKHRLEGADMELRYDAARRRAEVRPDRHQKMLAHRELVSIFDAENLGTNREEIDNDNGETRHVFFLKVHKAASTTVMNVLYRFALKRHLNIMLPKHRNVISESGKGWRHNVMPPPRVNSHFDILCNHVVFHEESVRSSLPADTRFIGIVREPFQQFVSAFLYYRTNFRIGYLTRIDGPDPIATYLQNPAVHEARSSQSSYTHNRMSFDFGMEPSGMGNKTYISDYVTYLNRTFHLVMVSERFDESMVLLKRLLGWRLQDVLYIKNNVFTKGARNNYTKDEKKAHREFNAADYALYEHFSRLFQRRVEAEGRLFSAEVAAYVSLREKVEGFCGGPHRNAGLIMPATPWTSRFEVSKVDCLLMTEPEVPFVSFVRSRQYGSHFMQLNEAMQVRRRIVPMENYRMK